MSIFVTGDSRPHTVTLTINGTPFDIPSGAVVKAALVSADRQRVLTPAPITLSSSTPGSDWAESTLVVKFPRASTVDIAVPGKLMKAFLEIQVTFDNPDVLLDDDDWTWHIPVEIVPGKI
jgi:hypothetical protein